MTFAAYTGHEPLTFPDYTDLGTGRTLAAEPGGTYDIAPASGRVVPGLPGGWFTPLDGDPARPAPDGPVAALEEDASGPAPDPGDDGSGMPGGPQQF